MSESHSVKIISCFVSGNFNNTNMGKATEVKAYANTDQSLPVWTKEHPDKTCAQGQMPYKQTLEGNTEKHLPIPTFW